MAASDKEMARRTGAVRGAMKGSGLRALIVFSTVVLGEKAAVRYLSNYRLLTRKDYMVLPLEGEPALVVATLNHQKGAAAASWIQDIRCGATTEGMIGEVAAKVRACGLETGAIGIVGLSGSIPHYDYRPAAKGTARGELHGRHRASRRDPPGKKSRRDRDGQGDRGTSRMRAMSWSSISCGRARTSGR